MGKPVGPKKDTPKITVIHTVMFLLPAHVGDSRPNCGQAQKSRDLCLHITDSGSRRIQGQKNCHLLSCALSPSFTGDSRTTSREAHNNSPFILYVPVPLHVFLAPILPWEWSQ
jgi:hypothetical protein